MSDDIFENGLSFDDDATPIKEDLARTAAQAVSSKAIEEKLTKEEKAKAEQAKKDLKDGKLKAVEVEDNWKEAELSDEELSIAKDLLSDLTGFMKKNVDIEPNTGKIETLPTGVDVLDAILGGGFGLGTLSVIAGNPGTFKSSLLGQVIGNSQLKFKGKLLANYLDSENSMTKDRLYQLGVKNPPIKPYSDVSVEGIFKTLEALCAFKEVKQIIEYPTILGWDSIANTTTETEKADSETSINSVIGLRARILSFLLPRYVSKMRQYNTSLIAINQLRDNINMGQYSPAPDLKWMGDKNMPGGNAIKFNAFHLLLLKVKGDLKEDQWGFNGVMLEAKCVKNKFFRPNIPIQMIVDFNTGISNFWTNFHFLKTCKYITGTNWQHLLTTPDKKWQGTKGCEKLYDTDPEFRKAFDESVSDAIKNEIVNKYKGETVDDE